MIASSHENDQGLPRRRSRLMLGVVIGVVVAFVAVGAVLASGMVLRLSVSSEKAAPVAAITQQGAAGVTGLEPGAAGSPQGDTPPAGPKSAMVRLESEPVNATVEWQGQVVGRTPIQLTVPLGLQAFSVSQPGYKRQDVVIDTSVAAGPEGFSTKIRLTAEEKAPPLVGIAKPRGGGARDDARTARSAANARIGIGAPVEVSTPSQPATTPSVFRSPAPSETPNRPVSEAPPKIRTIDVRSPTIKTIGDDSQNDSSKVKVIGND